MSLETVPKDLRGLRACLLCSLIKVGSENSTSARFSAALVGKMGFESGSSDDRSQNTRRFKPILLSRAKLI